MANRWPNFTAAPNALYNPSSTVCSTDLGITAWINVGLSAKKIVLFLPCFGFSWTLVNPKENGIGAPATGVAKGVKISCYYSPARPCDILQMEEKAQIERSGDSKRTGDCNPNQRQSYYASLVYVDPRMMNRFLANQQLHQHQQDQSTFRDYHCD
ncbi:hypothetical protein Q3G72_013063 [Acer saccharum]|nr:hypothetical protein Q3G72_013063 [Acer saccharum]